MNDGTSPEVRLRWANNRITDLESDLSRARAALSASDLERIRLRAALKEAIAEVEEHALEYQHMTPLAMLAEWKGLVST
jgi:hypothetical protein